MGRDIPRLRASCCSGSKPSVEPDERRRRWRTRNGVCEVEDFLRLWVLDLAGLVDALKEGIGTSDSSFFAAASTVLSAVL